MRNTLFAAVVMLLVGGLIMSRSQAAFGKPVPAPLPSGQTGDQAQIQNLRSALENPDLSAADRLLLEQKLETSQRLAARPIPEVVNALPTVILPTVEVPSALTQPEPMLLAASGQLIEGSEGLVHTWEAAVENMWQGQRAGIDYQVIAGSSVEPQAQGWLKVYESSQANPGEIQQIFLAPQTTSLRIVEVQDQQVLLKTPLNETLTFDLTTHTFQP